MSRNASPVRLVLDGFTGCQKTDTAGRRAEPLVEVMARVDVVTATCWRQGLEPSIAE